jgi:hypothetical protein
MKIYLSHNYAAREWLNEHVKPILEAVGYSINARWLKGFHTDRAEEMQQKYAHEDLMDVIESNIIIFFCDQFGERQGKGKFIELGVALTKSMKVWIVGQSCKESVFYFTQGVERFETFEDLLREKIYNA